MHASNIAQLPAGFHINLAAVLFFIPSKHPLGINRLSEEAALTPNVAQCPVKASLAAIIGLLCGAPKKALRIVMFKSTAPHITVILGVYLGYHRGAR